MWERRFNRDPSVIGKTIQVNRVPITLIGVTPPGFAGAMQVGESVDISLPLAQHGRFQPDRAKNRAQPWYWWIRVMGRLDTGVTAEQARASLEPIFQDTAREGWLAGSGREDGAGSKMPEVSTLAADPGGQGENDRRRAYAESLRILMGLVGVLLLVASANVANLFVARGSARRREIALRLALGASRARIVRQLLGESFLLAFTGTAFGILLAYWSRGLLLGLRQFNGDPAVLDLPLDGRVLAFTIAVTAGTALLFGLAPALRAARVDLTAEFQSGARLLGTRARSRLGQMLMVVQIALSLVLLIGAGLFVQTLRNLEQVAAGFNTQGLALFRIEATPAGYPREAFTMLQSRLQERLEQIPGVRAATFSRVPLLAGTRANRRTIIPGYTPPAGASMNINVNGIAPNFFTAMEIPLLLGRTFTARDDEDAPKVAIVTHAFVRRYFAGENPVGRRFTFGANPNAPASEIEIVGVARDAKYTTLREAEPVTIYLPAPQMLDGVANYYVRTASDPAAIGPAIRAAVREIDPIAAGHRSPYAGAADRAPQFAGTPVRAVVGFLRRGRTDARVRGPVWTDVVPRAPTDRRDGLAAGARRAPGTGAADGAARIVHAGRGRTRARPRRRVQRPSVRRVDALRTHRCRPADLCRRRWRARRRHAAGVAPSRAAGRARRSDDRAARRIVLSLRGVCPSDSPTRSLARRFAGSLRSRGSLARLARSVERESADSSRC